MGEHERSVIVCWEQLKLLLLNERLLVFLFQTLPTWMSVPGSSLCFCQDSWSYIWGLNNAWTGKNYSFLLKVNWTFNYNPLPRSPWGTHGGFSVLRSKTSVKWLLMFGTFFLNVVFSRLNQFFGITLEQRSGTVTHFNYHQYRNLDSSVRWWTRYSRCVTVMWWTITKAAQNTFGSWTDMPPW